MTDDFWAVPEPPVPEPEPEPMAMPPWFGPPRGVLPGIVALELVLARAEAAVVAITRLAAYPTGLAFELVTLQPLGGPDLDPLLFEGRRARHGEPPPDRLRFGVEFDDGRRATNLAPHPMDAPDTPVLVERGGGGGGGEWNISMWLWPLPAGDELTVACEWPAAGIPMTTHRVALAPVAAAAGRAQTVF